MGTMEEWKKNYWNDGVLELWNKGKINIGRMKGWIKVTGYEIFSSSPFSRIS